MVSQLSYASGVLLAERLRLFDWTCILWMAVVAATTDTAVDTANRARFDFLLKRLNFG